MAEALFRERGYTAVAMRDIAEAAGMHCIALLSFSEQRGTIRICEGGDV